MFSADAQSDIARTKNLCAPRLVVHLYGVANRLEKASLDAPRPFNAACGALAAAGRAAPI
jgi:hypothetical protein